MACVVCGKPIAGGYFMHKYGSWRLPVCSTEHHVLMNVRLKPLRGVRFTDTEALGAIIRGEAEPIPPSLKMRAMLKFFGRLLDS